MFIEKIIFFEFSNPMGLQWDIFIGKNIFILISNPVGLQFGLFIGKIKILNLVIQWDYNEAWLLANFVQEWNLFLIMIFYDYFLWWFWRLLEMHACWLYMITHAYILELGRILPPYFKITMLLFGQWQIYVYFPFYSLLI